MSHSHSMSDLRVAVVRVTEVTQCGFRYEDLQEGTVSAEPIASTPPGEPFKLGRISMDGKPIGVTITQAKPEKGKLGILVYCYLCRAGCLVDYDERVTDGGGKGGVAK